MLALVGLLILHANVNFANLNGHGRVLDFKTREPVADVQLTGDCARPRLIHGTRTLRTLMTRSDSAGGYHFRFRDTWHCSLFFMNAEKAGYVRIENAYIPGVSGDLDWDSVPSVTWMVNEKDLVPLRLDGLLAEADVLMHHGDGSGRRAYVEEFNWALERFTRARSMATTDEQQAWIREKFCPLLSRKFDAMPAEDRTRVLADWPDYCGQAVADTLSPSVMDPAVSSIAPIHKLPCHVLGDEVKVAVWLTSRSRVLGEVPLYLLETDIGTQRVERELRQIEFGIPS